MTMKPKAKKFRIKRPAAADEKPAEGEKAAAPAAMAPRRPRPQAPAQPETAESPMSGTDIASIRDEGLTGRQLRMARRMAQKNGLTPSSDYDAVRQLRLRGIDPFQRLQAVDFSAIAQTPQPPTEIGGTPLGKVQLPQAVKPEPQTALSPKKASPALRREAEIAEIQRGIAKRRRKRIVHLFSRLAFFVFLPTLIAGWYFYAIATPMYATNSEFIVDNDDSAGGTGPLGNLLPSQFANSQDSIAVQSYLQSKDAMLRLDADQGFKAHFSQNSIDPIQRLPQDPSNEEAYKLYKKVIKIGFDPTEGVIRLEVIAADPEMSQSFSTSLISYAEERVNALSSEKRENRMRDARAALAKAEEDRHLAQSALVELQIEGATLDPEAVIAALRAEITSMSSLITEKKIELQTLLNNPRPNQAKVDGARNALEILQAQKAELESQMTDMSQGENSLARLAINIRLAEADLANRDLMLQSALQQMEQAQTEADRQVRYLTVSVQPVTPEDPSYPRSFENTVLAFLFFAGIYLMMSLTASILREQVSS